MAVNATAVWRVRPSGSNTNGGGYDPGISGAATDYSQQNSAQATGTHGTASGTTAFSDTTAAAFTSAMVGNALWIASGSGFTVGPYFVTAFTDASHVTLDRSPGTGTVAVWALGGGWADFWTNTTSVLAYLVPGNVAKILGSGTPNPSSYVYDYTYPGTGFTPVAGDATNGRVAFVNDPATPGYKAPPDTTGGMPTISTGGRTFDGPSANNFYGLWFVTTTATGSFVITGSSLPLTIVGCVFDSFGQNLSLLANAADGSFIAGNEFFTSTPGGSSGQNAVVLQDNILFLGNNVHDNPGVGVACSGNGRERVINNIIAKNGNDGLQAQDPKMVVLGNTIDGNAGHGISVDTQSHLSSGIYLNNVITNHTGAGKAGFAVLAGTAGPNSLIAGFFDYNSFYNNTSNYTAINAGPHDTALGGTPYNASATEDYKLI